MHHRTRAPLFALLLALILAALPHPPAAAQEDSVTGWLIYPLNMRTGPAATFAAITHLLPGTALTLEGRSGDETWLLARTAEGVRGWVPSVFVAYPGEFDPAALPVTRRQGDDPAATEIGAAFDAAELPAADPDYIRRRAAEIDLMAVPVLPETLGRAAEIYARGQTLGRTPNALAKVGDCNTTGWIFLHPFAEDQYDLGEYGELQPVIDFFKPSLNQRTYAAFNGLNAAGALDPLWANPYACEPGESPLACDYRLHNPSVALVMFGTNDLVTLTPEQFDYHLRRVISATIDAGIIPVISTFPRHLSFPDRSELFNQIVVRIALDYDIPLINLFRALEPLPGHGIAPDGFHLSGPHTRAGDLRSAKNLQTGYPLRNLLTLQTLDRVWREVIQAGE